METKEISQKLNQLIDKSYWGGEHYVDLSLFIQAADRLEELEAEIAELEKQLSEKETEWISVEDEPPKEPGRILINRKNSTRVNTYSYQGNEKELKNFAYWMPMPKAPEAPKPKKPTFKDVFLKAFPKAVIDMKGSPEACLEDVFPWAKHPNCGNNVCTDCWNQPYFEEEGEADA